MKIYIKSATILFAALAFIGYYWSSTPGDSSHAYSPNFNSGGVFPATSLNRNDAYAIRLVTNVK